MTSYQRPFLTASALNSVTQKATESAQEIREFLTNLGMDSCPYDEDNEDESEQLLLDWETAAVDIFLAAFRREY